MSDVLPGCGKGMRRATCAGRGACAKFDVMRAALCRLLLLPLLLPLLMLACAGTAGAQASADDTVLQAREALRKNNKPALATARLAVNTARHPLAMWVEYWELGNRLAEAQQSELDSFYARWPGSYVEDRLRNDWLLELGRRRDWANVRTEFPRFRMNDDREVTCYALLAQHLAGADVTRAAARSAWWAQRDLDDGCHLMARTLYEARVLSEEDVWQEARLSVENNRPRAAKAAVALLSPALGDKLAQIIDDPARYLLQRGAGDGRHGHELMLLALLRMAANDPDYAAGQLQAPTAHRLPMALEATAWAHIAKQAALKQLPQAAEPARRAWKVWDAAHKPGMQPPWSDELLAWHVRAALREPPTQPRRWSLVQRAIEAMPADEQADAAWVYWMARATQAQAKTGPAGDSTRAASRTLLEGIAPQIGFYGQLAAEELGERMALPASPLPPQPAEREAVRANPGFVRALQLINLGLRNEGVREWNFTLRGMADRELLAAAQLACEREVWDRCINTSERTRTQIDVAQRYPTPLRDKLQARARDSGVDAAVLYGLIRQESRFIMDARSSVGASGLMQLMPATAKWTAKKVGLDYRPDMITDPGVNLHLGAAYLKRVLDEFGGSLAMAAAAYNAGPGRPRKWREGVAPMEPAAWAETIPFNETRDYVKKVLANSVVYAALLAPQPLTPLTPDSAVPRPPTLKARLGAAIGPREPSAALPDRDIP